LNRRIANLAEGIIVHSEWSRARFAAIAPTVPLTRISMPVKFPDDSARHAKSSEVVKIASFGLITPGKGSSKACARWRLSNRRTASVTPWLVKQTITSMCANSFVVMEWRTVSRSRAT